MRDAWGFGPEGNLRRGEVAHYHAVVMSIADPVRAPELVPPRQSGATLLRVLPRTFASLRHRAYLYLWLGVVFHSTAHWMEQVSMGWLLYEMTDSPFLLGSLMGARALPFLFFSTLAGVAADRVDRRSLLLGTQVVVLTCYCVLVSLLITNLLEVWHLFAFALAASIAWSFNAPVRHAVIRDLVPGEDVVNAVALTSGAHNLTRVLGPAAGGVLMATVGGVATFALITLSFLGVLVVTLLIPIAALRRQGPARAPRGVIEDLVGALRFVATHPLIRGLMLLAMVPMVLGHSYSPLVPVFARDVFGMDASGAGQLMGASGVGAIASTLAVASLGAGFRGNGKLMLGAGLITGLALMVFGISTSYLLALGSLVVAGLGSMAYGVMTHATIQLATPQAYMGRVMSIYMLDRGLMPLGSMVAGGLAEAFGGPIAIVAMGAGCAALVALGIAMLPDVRRLQ